MGTCIDKRQNQAGELKDMCAGGSRDHLAQRFDCNFCMADHAVDRNDRRLEPKRDFVEFLVATYDQSAFGIAESIVDSARRVTLAGDYIQLREPPMISCLRGLDELSGPRDGFVLFSQYAEDPCVKNNAGGRVDIAVVSCPAKCSSKISQFNREPGVGLPLSRTVPH